MEDKYELINILKFYTENFCQRDCLIEVNYSPIGIIQLSFEENSLHHLLGLQYVTSKRASENIQDIKSGELTYRKIKKNDNFYKIKYRIYGIYSLSSMLISPQVDVCILAKDIDYNSMKIDVMLFDSFDSKKVILLGLRKNKKTGIYYPTTLFRTEKKKYEMFRKTKIKKIIWI